MGQGSWTTMMHFERLATVRHKIDTVANVELPFDKIGVFFARGCKCLSQVSIWRVNMCSDDDEKIRLVYICVSIATDFWWIREIRWFDE
jgi:hypothetical protein